MLNIYRVISMSLVMSLFFAAPLLCIRPASYQLREVHGLASKDDQQKRVRVVWKRGSHPLQARAVAALANTLQRSENEVDEVLYDDREKQIATPAIFVQDQDGHWYDNSGHELDDRPSGVNGVSSASHTSIYY